MAFGFWYWWALATGTTWAGLSLIQHHQRPTFLVGIDRARRRRASAPPPARVTARVTAPGLSATRTGAPAAALGDGAPLLSVTPETLLAVAFSSSESSRLLKITPMEFVGEWGSAIDDRAGGTEDAGAAAETAYVNASAAANTAAQRRAIDVIVAKDGKMMLSSRFNERLPGAAGGTVDCTAFPRLSKLAPGAAAQVPEAHIRALASQLQVELPATADLSEGARAKWIWGLSRLSRSLTARAVGWLGLAVSDEDGQAALGDLRRDGRFTSEWMTTKRLERTAERVRVDQRRAQGAGYDERVSNLEVWAHVSGAARDAAADSALASQVAKPRRRCTNSILRAQTTR